MSLRAMLWALEHAPVSNPSRVVLLLALADRANDDGTAAWPTQEWMAHRARCSTRSVRRYLQSLEQEDGVIRRGDQTLVEHLRRDQRPVVWDLVLEATWDTAVEVNPAGTGGQSVRPFPATAGQPDRPDSENDRTAQVERPDRAGHNGRTLLSTEPSFTPYGSETVREPSTARDLEVAPTVEFEAFWAAYPRHTEKAAARKSWAKAVKVANPLAIVAGAARYAADPNREPAYTKHPATWLNRGCWEDDALPTRSRAGAAANQQHHDDLFDAAARRAAAAEGRGHLHAIGGGR